MSTHLEKLVPLLSEEQLEAGRTKAIRLRREASDHRIRQIKALLLMGYNQAQIARELGMKRQSVHRIVKRERLVRDV